MQQPGLQASASKLKLDSLFLQWFSMPETQRLVSQPPPDVVPQQIALAPSRKAPQPNPRTIQVLELLDDVKNGRRAALAPGARKGGSPSNQVGRRRRLSSPRTAQGQRQGLASQPACAYAGTRRQYPSNAVS